MLRGNKKKGSWAASLNQRCPAHRLAEKIPPQLSGEPASKRYLNKDVISKPIDNLNHQNSLLIREAGHGCAPGVMQTSLLLLRVSNQTSSLLLDGIAVCQEGKVAGQTGAANVAAQHIRVVPGVSCRCQHQCPT